MSDVTFIVAFTTGLLTFFAPCTFVALPAFFAYITSQATQTGTEEGTSPVKRSILIKGSIAYSLGFLTVFMLLGASASLLGNFFSANKDLFAQIGGVFMIFGGLFMLFGEKIPALQLLFREKKFHLDSNNRFLNSYLFPYLIGLTTAFAWTPCVGPVLGSILFLAGASSETPLQGALLLLVHGLGIVLPFIIIAIAFERLSPLISKFGKYSFWIYRISALILIIIGISLLIGSYDIIAQQIYILYVKLGFEPH